MEWFCIFIYTGEENGMKLLQTNINNNNNKKKRNFKQSIAIPCKNISDS